MTDRPQVVVSSIQLSHDSLELGYMVLPTGVRDIAGSPVAMMSSFLLETDSPAYADQIGELRQVAEALVADVLDDWETATPVAMDEQDEDDDDRGMGE